jgi:hypothetical protein
MPAIGLGLSIVTLWVPYPVAGGPGRAGSGGQLAAPAEDVLASRLTDSTLTHALTDAALASRLVDEVLASVTADPARRAAQGARSGAHPGGPRRPGPDHLPARGPERRRERSDAARDP